MGIVSILCALLIVVGGVFMLRLKVNIAEKLNKNTSSKHKFYAIPGLDREISYVMMNKKMRDGTKLPDDKELNGVLGRYRALWMTIIVSWVCFVLWLLYKSLQEAGYGNPYDFVRDFLQSGR